jgi:hypothetical protein
MKFRVVLCSVILAGLLAGGARADIVHLRSGGRIEGVVEVRGDSVTVTNRFGSTTVPLSSVDFVEKTETALDKYEALNQRAATDDLNAQRELARFCRENFLTSRERYHLLLILRLRPDDTEARSRLGFVQYRGEWVTKSEEMYDRGLIRFRGDWVTHEAKQDVLAQEREHRRELAAKRREEREQRMAELRAKRLAEERRNEEKERRSGEVLGIGYVDDYNYRSRAYYPYPPRYSLTAPCYGGWYYHPYSEWQNSWGWYRRWTGVGLSGEYRSRDWRVRWGR